MHAVAIVLTLLSRLRRRRYLLLDHDGIVRHTWSGWTLSTDGDIESKAKKLLIAIPR